MGKFRMQTQIDKGHRTIKLKEERQHDKEKWKVQMKGHNQADVKTVKYVKAHRQRLGQQEKE